MCTGVLFAKTYDDARPVLRASIKFFCTPCVFYLAVLREALEVCLLALGHLSNHVSGFISMADNMTLFRAELYLLQIFFEMPTDLIAL